MIGCLFMRAKIYEYVDGGLSEEQAVAVANHLEACPACRRREEQIRELLTRAARPVPMPSEDFWRDFKAGLDDKLNHALFPETGAASPRLRLTPLRGFSQRLCPAAVLAFACLAVLVFSVSLRSLKPLASSLDVGEEAELVEALSAVDEYAFDLIPIEELEEFTEAFPA